MTTNDKFDYVSKYATYKGCNFVTNHYGCNGNNYLAIEDEEGPICTCSVNAERINAEDEIGIKDYSENEGMVDFLKKIGIIESEPIAVERSGWVEIPYFKLTAKGKELFA